MNDQGAININDFTKNRYNNEEFVSPINNLTADERARHIKKAKNDLYFTEVTTTYSLNNR